MKKMRSTKKARILALLMVATLGVTIFTPVHATSFKSARLKRILAGMHQRQAARKFAQLMQQKSPFVATSTVNSNAVFAPTFVPQPQPAPAPAPIPQPQPLPLPEPVADPVVIPQLRNGLYVWKSTDLLADPDAWISKLQDITIGGGQKINEIYLSVYHGSYKGREKQFADAIEKLHAANYQVYMLAGNHDWAIPETWNWINDNYVPLVANFDGVMLDVEPWTGDATTKAWWASSRAPQDFATHIDNWRSAIGTTKKLTLSIANWHDVITPSQKDFLATIYASKADFITIMDYATSSYISRIAHETTLAKPTSVAFDINKVVTPDPAIIFYNLVDLQKAVEATLETYPSIRGFAINDQTLLNAK